MLGKLLVFVTCFILCRFAYAQEWSVTEFEDELYNQKSRLSLLVGSSADDHILMVYNINYEEKSRVIIRVLNGDKYICKDINFEDLLIFYRFDDEEVATQTWDIYKNSMIESNEREALEFIENMDSSKSLIFRSYDGCENQVTMKFDVSEWHTIRNLFITD